MSDKARVEQADEDAAREFIQDVFDDDPPYRVDKEEEVVKPLASLIAQARAGERERCARLAETQYRRDADDIDRGWNAHGVQRRVSKRIAAAIRARGEGE